MLPLTSVTADHLNSDHLGIGTARTSTPSSIKFSQTQPGNLSSLRRKKTAKHSVKEMVTLILKELDDSMAAATVDQDGSEANLEDELPSYKRGKRMQWYFSWERARVTKLHPSLN